MRAFLAIIMAVTFLAIAMFLVEFHVPYTFPLGIPIFGVLGLLLLFLDAFLVLLAEMFVPRDIPEE